MHLRLSPSTGWAYSRSYGRLYGLTCGRMRLPTKSARKTGRRTDGGSCCVTPLLEAEKSLRHSDKSCSDSSIATKCTRIPAYCLPEHWQCHGTDAINRHLLRRGLGASPPAITPKGRIPPEPVPGNERLTVTRREGSKRSPPCAQIWRTVLGEERCCRARCICRFDQGPPSRQATRTRRGPPDRLPDARDPGDRCGAKPYISLGLDDANSRSRSECRSLPTRYAN